MATVSATRREVRPIAPAVGAEVTGIDLHPLDEDGFRLIESAWYSHGVVLLRDQRLSDDDLIAFSRRFGALDLAPISEHGRASPDQRPEIHVVSNVLGPDGKPIGSLGAGEALWHTDMSYLPAPPDASMLYALEIPPTGGDTWFCGMEAALASMPGKLLQRISGLSIKHDATYNSGGYLRANASATEDPATSVGQVHPAVITHPRTGRQALYLGRRRLAYIVGLPLAESEALLDEIWAHATKPEHCFIHRWRVGDLLFWDNRAVMHRRDPFDAASRRIMHRTQISGTAQPQAA